MSIDNKEKMSTKELFSPSETKIHLHPSGGIDITTNTNSPVHVHQLDSNQSFYNSSSLSPPTYVSPYPFNSSIKKSISNSDTSTELEQLKQTLKRLTSDTSNSSISLLIHEKDNTISSKSTNHLDEMKSNSSFVYQNNDKDQSDDIKSSLKKTSFSLFNPPDTSMKLNQSFSSSISSGGDGHGSKAVLSALRALQDKIRRLENEKEQLLKQTAELKTETRKKEANYNANLKRFEYELSSSKDSAHVAYESIRNERDELKISVAQYEEKNKAMIREVSHYKTQCETYEKSLQESRFRVETVEKKNIILKEEIKNMSKEMDLKMNEMTNALRLNEKSIFQASERYETLLHELEKEKTIHMVMEKQMKENEESLRRMINNKLQRKKKKNTTSSGLVNHSNSWNPSIVTNVTRSTSASRAASIESTTPITRIRERKNKKKINNKTNMELLIQANHGKQVPFLLGHSVHPSHSIIGNVQQAMRKSDAYAAIAPDRNRNNTKTTKTKSSSNSKIINISKQSKIKSKGVSKSISSSIPQKIEIPHVKTLFSPTSTILSSSSSPSSLEKNKNKMMELQMRNHNVTKYDLENEYQRSSYFNGHIEQEIHHVEIEFNQLNERYKKLMADAECGRIGSETNLSTTLHSIIDELEKKGKELYDLKQKLNEQDEEQRTYFSSSNEKKFLVHSPAAIQKKQTALRVLHEYRELEKSMDSTK